MPAYGLFNQNVSQLAYRNFEWPKFTLEDGMLAPIYKKLAFTNEETLWVTKISRENF